MPNKQTVPVIDESVRSLCYRPYPLHPKGCPNFGKKITCPPKVALIGDIIDLSKPVYAIWNIFDLGAHVQKMKDAHPQWSKRQLECCLYWQPRARKILQGEIDLFRLMTPGMIVLTCPEACGVNVTETMKGIGEVLEWPPITKTYQVAIAGSPHGKEG